ncbi:MAG: hypothetical protein ACREUA_11325 [Burkholderiales bacterium]
MLFGDQGIGDDLFFLRFAAEAQARGARLIFKSTAKLASLIKRAPCIDEVIDHAEYPGEMDKIFSVAELPLLLGMKERNDIPPLLGLTVLPERLTSIQKRLVDIGNGPYLGVTWRAGRGKTPGEKWTLSKQISPALLANTLKSWQGQVLVLQRNPRSREIEAFRQALEREVHNFSDLNENLEEMLALLSIIDEYMGVSNTNMHLRAGVGKTARVLIPNPPEWRWMAESDESPWFPGFSSIEKATGWREAWGRLTLDLSIDNCNYN